MKSYLSQEGSSAEGPFSGGGSSWRPQSLDTSPGSCLGMSPAALTGPGDAEEPGRDCLSLWRGRDVTHLSGLLTEPPQQQHHHVHSGSSHFCLRVRLGYGCHTGGDLWGQGGRTVSKGRGMQGDPGEQQVMMRMGPLHPAGRSPASTQPGGLIFAWHRAASSPPSPFTQLPWEAL